MREEDVPAAKVLRERLREAFDATSEEDAVSTLNAVLVEHADPPRLERTSDGWRFRYGPAEAAGRFGRCRAHPCRCVFVDRSRNRSRRYCCELCADRATQAAARRRRAKS